MSFTRPFRETVLERANIDPAFREGLLTEGMECLLSGEVGAAKIILCDYIDATIGFDELAALTNQSTQSLMRMFDPADSAPARDILEVISHIQKPEGVRQEATALP